MEQDKILIYVDPHEDMNTYPASLVGNMSVFKDFRSEVQWIFYLMLKNQGMDVGICRDYPPAGIFVIHKGNVRKFVWNPGLFVVSLQWDYPRDDRGQVHLVSNIHKTTNASLGWLDRFSFPGRQCYLPPVTHPVIIPRNPEHGNRFENITFIGDPKNLDEAFRTDAFKAQIAALGMKFIITSDPHKMSDFSNVDAVIAIRKIGRVISNKPPTKLINAWRGGVPSVLGCEIGFREARKNEYDYIEVDSVEDVINALTRLKNDVGFRNEMIANAKRRAAPFSAEEQQQIWVGFFKDTVVPAYHDWQRRSALGKYTFLFFRGLRYWMRESLSFIWHRVLRCRHSDYS